MTGYVIEAIVNGIPELVAIRASVGLAVSASAKIHESYANHESFTGSRVAYMSDDRRYPVMVHDAGKQAEFFAVNQ